MATYDSLTDEQKADYKTYAKSMIGAASSIGAIARAMDFEVIEQFGADNVAAFLAGLDAGEVLPNPTGLGDAKDMTVEDFIVLQAWVRSIFNRDPALQSAFVKAVGVNAQTYRAE